MTGTRAETDSFGLIAVPETVRWGAQTARSLRLLPLVNGAPAAARDSRAGLGQVGGDPGEW